MMRDAAAICCLFMILTAVPVRAEDAPIVPPGAKLELLYTRTANLHNGLTEGPAVAPDGSIYFTDIPLFAEHSMILHFDPKTKKIEVFSDNAAKANGMQFDKHGD